MNEEQYRIAVKITQRMIDINEKEVEKLLSTAQYGKVVELRGFTEGMRQALINFETCKKG